MLYADVYFNSKTFSQSEKIDDIVYIGHADAKDGGDPANALVTVKSGAVWTNTQSVVLGATANGKSRLTVESGGAVNFATLMFPTNQNMIGGHGVFELQENAKAVISNITVFYASKKLVGNSGVISLADGSSISGICSFKTGSTNCVTRVEIEGGKLEFDSSENAARESMRLGDDYHGGYAGGVLSGWGFVGFSNPNLIMNFYDKVGRVDNGSNPGWGQFRLYGQVIADGKGFERDLDFSKMGVPDSTSTDNQCGTNGWYAINKGRLLMPRFPKRKDGNYQYIGGFPFRGDIDLVNSFKYYFDDVTRRNTRAYIFSELYAVDRSDIPAGLPKAERYQVSSVWRIGHFDVSNVPNTGENTSNNKLTKDCKVGFQSVNLLFHYDPRLAQMKEVDIIKVYRCADEKSGIWQCVGTAIPSDEKPHIQTEDFGPSSDLYNFGWFAIVGEKQVGTVVVVR
jgi:T5SS/PEP-CTERM-associated repeat protein